MAEYVARARSAGAFTLAITNDEDSTLAGVAHRVLPTGAGEERAVAATKTYTSQLAALALFWSAWTGDDGMAAALREDVPRAMNAALALEEAAADIAARLSHAGRLLVTGRGLQLLDGPRDGAQGGGDLLPAGAAVLGRRPASWAHRRDRAALPGAALRPQRAPRIDGMLELHDDLRSRGAQTFVVTDGDDEFAGAAASCDSRSCPSSCRRSWP